MHPHFRELTSAVPDGAQETKKLRELEVLIDVRRVIASTDAQRQSLLDMGIDVEKNQSGSGGLVGAISPVLLLGRPHWMHRISEVLTERMNAELDRGEAAVREREREGEADCVDTLEEEGGDEEDGEDETGGAKQRAKLMLLSVARTAACQKSGEGGAEYPHPPKHTPTHTTADAATTTTTTTTITTAAAAHGYRFVHAGTVAIGALKHKVREKESNKPRHICVRLWDGWMRTASLQIELEASQWLHGRAMARAVLTQSPASLLLAMRRDAAEATVEAARGGGGHRRSAERKRVKNSGRRAGTITVKPGQSIFF